MTAASTHPNTLTRRRFGAMLLAGGIAGPALAAPAARLIDPRWRQTGQAGDPDHGPWDAILTRHLVPGSDGINRFDYGRADKGAVDAYLRAMSAVDPSTLRAPAAFAYWVNVYNALTVSVVLGAYPVASIRRIGGSLFSPGPWRQPLFSVAGSTLSLDDIEHGILRPVFREPRVHYAVNCAALGCPNLATRAYTSARLGAMLDAGARAYVAHPRGARLVSGGLRVSSIYTWFQADFGGSESGVIDHLRQYATGEKAESLAGVTRILGDDYDWSLNSV